ncbi:type 2 lanthipeptide synthetase LanM family protein [Streptomyces sp. NPDC088341]|uniref:type 2 lanthipeptide synthetase LanM family protein n=1 Tax=Streptomyces sp. NPDC088341 TaxID=3154870 RepID=UPI00342EC0B9
MTSSAPLSAAAPGLPRRWWAYGLTLRERLALPHAPVPAAPGGTDGHRAPTGGHRALSELEQACWSTRLSVLGIGPDLAAALAGESAERLGARADEPDWALFIEKALAAAPDAPHTDAPHTDAPHVDAPHVDAPHVEGPYRAEAAQDAEATQDSEDASRAEGTSRTQDTSGAEGSDVFVPLFRPLVDAAVHAMTRKHGPLDRTVADTAALTEGFADRLGRQLARRAARTLAAELAAARTAGLLTGIRPEDRFADFLRRTGGARGLARLFADYPVLARLLAQTCQFAADAVAELLTRFAADRTAIVAELLDGSDPGPLLALDLGLGDTHERGRSVALLRFADGSTVVYKPRPLSQYAFLDRMVEWLNGKVPGLGLRTAATVARDGYGWLQYIAHLSCSSVADIHRFYRRQGALLALVYAVEGSDLHYDNLVAHGDQPVLVDVETLLHATPAEPMTAGPDPASAALAASVHRTCLLPQLMVGELGAVDISAVGGAPDDSGPHAEIAWEGAGTDTMRPVRRPVPFTGGRNRPLLAGKDVAAGEYGAALLGGFRAGYDAIVAHRDELRAPDGPLTREGAAGPGRLIVRPTQLYATLLKESLHPDVLRDALDRDALLSLLWAESSDDPAGQRVIEDEIADLWCGDIPVFFHRPTGSEVWTSRGSRISGVLDTSGIAAALEKIGAMGEVDRHDQEWIISASLATAGPSSGSRHRPAGAPARTTPAAVPEPSVLLAAASGIADEIVARAVHGPGPTDPRSGHGGPDRGQDQGQDRGQDQARDRGQDRGRANWIGLELVDDAHWAVLPMGASLAQGYCGVSLFLAQLGRLTGSSRYTDLARKALAPVSTLVAALASDPGLSRTVGPGAFHGLGGICYAVARLTTLLGEDDSEGKGEAEGEGGGTYEPGTGGGEGGEMGATLRTAVAALALSVDDTPGAEVSLDVSTGLAGALAALLAVREERGTPEAAAHADRIAELLLSHTDHGRRGTGTPGFAFGDAGIGWSLLRYAASGDGDGDGDRDRRPYAEAGRRLLDSALAAAERNAAEDAPEDLSWCSGLSGAVLAAADRLGRPVAGGAAGAATAVTETSFADASLTETSFEEKSSARLDAAVRVLGAQVPLTDHSLCHGDLGTVEPLAVLAARGHPDARTALARRAGLTVGAFQYGGHLCGTPGRVHSPGLLTGLSGIGYALLRLGFTDRVPSVLLLDPTPSPLPATPGQDTPAV